MYKKILIKSEEDLPEKYDTYNTSIGRIRFGGVKPYNRFIRVGHLRIDWYLIPDLTNDSDIEAWAEEKCKDMDNMSLKFATKSILIEGAKAMRDSEIKHFNNK